MFLSDTTVTSSQHSMFVLDYCGQLYSELYVDKAITDTCYNSFTFRICFALHIYVNNLNMRSTKFDSLPKQLTIEND